MRYAMIEEKDGAIEIISSRKDNAQAREMIDAGGKVVGYIECPLQISYLRAGLEKRESQRTKAALNKLYKIKRIVREI